MSRKSKLATGPSALPTMLCLDLCMPTPDKSEGVGSGGLWRNTDNSESEESEGTLTQTGSFNWDQEEGGYSLEWADLAKFELWCQTEEHLGCIELIVSSTWIDRILFSWWQCFVCGCKDSGGNRNYEKKHLDRQGKLKEDRKSSCSCHIDIKQYPHMSTILGRYIDKHDHEIGATNITYTRLSNASKNKSNPCLVKRLIIVRS